jgi:NitT/TauT family transport system substrate-binding protein
VSPLVYVLGKMMETVGLGLKDLELVNIAFPTMATAFGTRAIDAAIAVEPFVTLMHEKGTALRWKGTTDFVSDPAMHISTYLVNHEWAEKHSRAMQDFLVAYVRGLRVYHDAVVTGKGRDELVNVFVRYTSVKDRALYDRMTWQFVDPDGVIGRRSVEDQIAWYASHGMITRKLAVDGVLDMRYLAAALKEIGTVPCPRCAAWRP